MKQNKLFISINFGGLKKVIGSKRDELGIQFIEKNKILYFNFKENYFQPDELDTDLYLIQDSLNSIVTNKEISYVIHHSTFNLKDYFKKSLLGQHEENDPIYTKVFQIIFDNSIENKVEEIIQLIFEKEKQAFKDATKIITLAFLLKEKGDSAYIEKLKGADKELLIIKEYFKDSLEMQKQIQSIIDESDADIKIKSFQNLSSDVQDAFRKETKS